MSEKLVRDLIPAIITESGGVPRYRVAESEKEMQHFLREKLIEEYDEIVEAEDYRDKIEEAGDILEVVRAVFRLNGVSMKQAEAAADQKYLKRGGFTSGYILHT